MRDETAGADLLQVARDALVAEVMPGLAGPQRYAALMVANALKMVERELVVNGHVRAADRAVQAFAGPVDTPGGPAKALAQGHSGRPSRWGTPPASSPLCASDPGRGDHPARCPDPRGTR